jgi:hypothetical protein
MIVPGVETIDPRCGSELLAALSLDIDMGMGHPMEHVLRQSPIALRLAERLRLAAEDRRVVYYASLLAWVGCHVDAYEQANWFGDDLALKHDIRFGMSIRRRSSDAGGCAPWLAGSAANSAERALQAPLCVPTPTSTMASVSLPRPSNVAVPARSPYVSPTHTRQGMTS